MMSIGIVCAHRCQSVADTMRGSDPASKIELFAGVFFFIIIVYLRFPDMSVQQSCE